MKPIVTLTLNPSVDSSCQADDVVAIRKVRTFEERYEAGGGGINVSRVIRELGGETIAVYLAGGLTGHAFNDMVDEIGLDTRHIEIAGSTRVSHVVYERSTGQEFRFTPSGPEIRESEWRSCLEVLSSLEFDYIVASGSLPRGVQSDFYARVAHIAHERGARFVLDTSGTALYEALKEGVYLVKPNLRELQHLLGRKAHDRAEQAVLALEVVSSGRAEIVTLSLGADGALLAHDNETRHVASPHVEVRSAVGAGDSFVGAMTLGLAQERSLLDAFILGVATGTATVMTMGTELCHREDVENLYEQIKQQF
ncbi:MAG: 1-phosphofructokinase family hexose kinase [Alphaproteobacteria bacterium]